MNTNTNTLARKALMTTLETGAWRANKLHQSETARVNIQNGAGDVARVSVKLTNHPALVALGKLHAAARAEHYRVTLPSAQDGFRFLPCGRELEHSQTMQKFATEHERLTVEFIGAYDVERSTAPARLGALFDGRHWPTSVAGKFRFNTRYLPVPEAGLWQEWIAESALEAQDELRGRLAEAVKKAAEVLKDPKAIFRDSLVGNLRDIAGLAGDLNLIDDPTIAAIAARVGELSKESAETLRNDPVARKSAAERAAEICANFNL